MLVKDAVRRVSLDVLSGILSAFIDGGDDLRGWTWADLPQHVPVIPSADV